MTLFRGLVDDFDAEGGDAEAHGIACMVWLSRAAMMSWQRLLEMQNSERLDSLSWVGDFIDFQFLSNFVIPSC